MVKVRMQLQVVGGQAKKKRGLGSKESVGKTSISETKLRI